MQEWLKISILLCTFGLVREIRPSEPYVTEFLTGEWRNFTGKWENVSKEDVVNSQVYPVGTYSYLAQLVLVFLVTDYLRYKPLIVVSGLCGVAVYVILLWTESLEWLQVSQFFYGLYLSTEVAYYTYMYAKVDEDKYERVSSWSRAAALCGRFLSGVSSQLLVSFEVLDYRQLNYITLATQICSIFFAVFLPSVSRSVYFHKEAAMDTRSEGSTSTRKIHQLKGITLLWEHIRSAYSRPVIIGWSLWYACSLCGFVQVQSYVQLLWLEIEGGQSSERFPFNGLVEAVLTILGAIAALIAGILKVDSKSFLLTVTPAIAAFIQAGAILAAVLAQDVWLSYVGYIILGICYHFMITIASAVIAKQLVYDNCFGLIFGINTLVGVALQSILTAVVISALRLPIKMQYIVYAVYYAVLGVIVLFVWIFLFLKRKKIKKDIE